ncbi:MAG: YicC/YloC family endoribonuclease [Clostridia bacterium]
MIKSMTGYGKESLIIDSREYQVEIKSVNHRYLDISMKLPRTLSYLEEKMKKIIASKVKRGKFDVYVNFINNSTEGKNIKINTEIAKMYIKELKDLAESENLISDINVMEIAKLPEVLNIQNTQEDDIIEKELEKVMTNAVDNLIAMRVAEGNKIEKDLIERLDIINEKVKEISELSTGLIQEYVVKLEGRIKELLTDQDIDKNRLAQETVIYADKCSIQEEVTRLDSHIAQFKQILNSNEAMGKKLDFLIQEMNRETNTIGSKANNLEITNAVIDIKTRFRRY